MAAFPEIEAYIGNAASRRGIDPAIALEVARREALNVFDPNKPDRGGDEGSSFGPYQFHYAGMSRSMPNAGLGDEFTRRTGLDARDPSTWRQQIDFALDWAKTHGWGDWMGAKAAGITGMMGIGGGGSSAPVDTAAAPTSGLGITEVVAPPSVLPEPDPYSSPIADVLSSRVADRPLTTETAAATDEGVPPPSFDFASAIPAAPPPAIDIAPTPLAADVAQTDGGLADLFKVKDIGRPVPRQAIGQRAG